MLAAPLPAQMPAPPLDSAARDRAVDTIAAEGGLVTVTTVGRTGIVFVSASTPTGTFGLRLDPGASDDWVARATAGAARVARSDTLIHAENTLQLRRMSGDSAGAYELTAANGAWDGSLVLSPDAARHLFAALRTPPMTRSVVDVASVTPDRQLPTPFSGQPPKYPPSLVKQHITGRVVMRFLIDTMGYVHPRSIWLLRSPHPLMSLAVRDALLQFRYEPATIDNRPVNLQVVQGFDFFFRR
jgi:hypothetical protein